MGRRGSYSDDDCQGLGTALVPGAARGRRTFHLDRNGYLRGVTYRAAWQAGENVARCLVAKPTGTVAMPSSVAQFAAMRTGWQYVPEHPELVLAPGMAPSPCTGMDPNCACGFYAYHSGQQTYQMPINDGIRVDGMIEAYGRLILGRWGFRAEKARIVAVCLPRPEDIERQVRVAQFKVNGLAKALELSAGRGVELVSKAVIAAATALLVYDAFFRSGMDPLRVAGAVTAGGLLLAATAAPRMHAQVQATIKRTLESEWRTAARALDRAKDMRDAISSDELRRLVEQRYPDAKVYGSSEDMLAEWPVEDLRYLLGVPADKDMDDN